MSRFARAFNALNAVLPPSRANVASPFQGYSASNEPRWQDIQEITIEHMNGISGAPAFTATMKVYSRNRGRITDTLARRGVYFTGLDELRARYSTDPSFIYSVPPQSSADMWQECLKGSPYLPFDNMTNVEFEHTSDYPLITCETPARKVMFRYPTDDTRYSTVSNSFDALSGESAARISHYMPVGTITTGGAVDYSAVNAPARTGYVVHPTRGAQTIDEFISAIEDYGIWWDCARGYDEALFYAPADKANILARYLEIAPNVPDRIFSAGESISSNAAPAALTSTGVKVRLQISADSSDNAALVSVYQKSVYNRNLTPDQLASLPADTTIDWGGLVVNDETIKHAEAYVERSYSGYTYTLKVDMLRFIQDYCAGDLAAGYWAIFFYELMPGRALRVSSGAVSALYEINNSLMVISTKIAMNADEFSITLELIGAHRLLGIDIPYTADNSDIWNQQRWLDSTALFANAAGTWNDQKRTIGTTNAL